MSTGLFHPIDRNTILFNGFNGFNGFSTQNTSIWKTKDVTNFKTDDSLFGFFAGSPRSRSRRKEHATDVKILLG